MAYINFLARMGGEDCPVPHDRSVAASFDGGDWDHDTRMKRIFEDPVGVSLQLQGSSIVISPDEDGIPLYFPPDVEATFTMSDRWISRGYKPQIGAFGIVELPNGKFLYVVKQFANFLSFPGGLVDQDDLVPGDINATLLACVKREIFEETGYQLNAECGDDPICVYESIVKNSEDAVTHHNFMVFYRFKASDICSVTEFVPNREIKDIREFTVAGFNEERIKADLKHPDAYKTSFVLDLLHTKL